MPNSHPICWTREPGLRLRPVPEQACCLVYKPPVPGTASREAPALHALNLTAWLVLTLCDGRDEAALSEEFGTALRDTGGPGASTAALLSALGQLHALGLVRKQPRGESA